MTPFDEAANTRIAFLTPRSAAAEQDQDERFATALENHQRRREHVAPFGECMWSGCREWAVEGGDTRPLRVAS